MLELIRYFRILFMNKKISRTRLMTFCDYHIKALINYNPGGVFTPLLNDVTIAYNAYFGDLASEATNYAVQQGKTIGMNESRDALEKNISINEGLIAYTYRDTPGVYQEFYPHGVFEYYKADITHLETISDRYRVALAARAGDFPLSFSTDYNTLQATFIANRQAQLAAMGSVAGERSDLAITRPALAKQLTKNLLLIAAHFLGEEGRCAAYFDTALLRAAFRENKRSMHAIINPAETQTIFNNIRKSSLRLTMKNETKGALYFGFTTSAEESVAKLKVDAGATVTLSAASLGWTKENKFFNVTNVGTLAGKYSVEKR